MVNTEEENTNLKQLYSNKDGNPRLKEQHLSTFFTSLVKFLIFLKYNFFHQNEFFFLQRQEIE